MDDVKKLINDALRMLSVIPVSGDNVDVMCAAKTKLRAAYAALSKKEEVSKDG